MTNAPDAYFARCRARADRYVDERFSVRGALSLHRAALGWDLARAPINVLLAIPALLVRLTALVSRACGRHRFARRLDRIPLGLMTRVERQLMNELRRQVFAEGAGEFGAFESTVPRGLADLLPPVLARYAGARTAAAEITVAILAGVATLALLDRFAPGALSAGRALADVVQHEVAVREFPLGDWLGGAWYGVFAPTTATSTIVLSILGVMCLLSMCAAFAGVAADPLQRALGLHRRRLRRMLDALQRASDERADARFEPRDHYAARATDALDIVRALWPG